MYTDNMWKCAISTVQYNTVQRKQLTQQLYMEQSVLRMFIRTGKVMSEKADGRREVVYGTQYSRISIA